MTSSSVSGHLQLITSDDGSSLLLDIQGDRIVHLNAVAAQMWQLSSSGLAESEIVSTIAVKYGVSQGRVAGDFQQLQKRIADLHLEPSKSCSLVNSFCPPKHEKQISYPWYADAGAGRPRPRTITVLAAILGLALFDLVLKVRSLRVLCSCVNSWRLSNQKSKDTEIKGKICTAVERACVWYPKKTFCLQRSAVTACLLRSYGVPAQMKIGIRPLPLMAHAWVEVGGAVVNDWPGVPKFYSSVVVY